MTESSPAALAGALHSGALSAAAAQNIQDSLDRPDLEHWERASIHELIEGEAWAELNDRFYTSLKFGTGGLRGRTVARRGTRAEQGSAAPGERPQHPAAGSNMMNHANVRRATAGVARYVRKKFPGRRAALVVAHDTRWFSPEFAKTVADTAASYGLDVHLFAEPTPTPELSFAVRKLEAQAGVMITASHNPYHDNGFKVYFADGGQIVEPHASGIIAEVQAGEPEAPGCEPGRIHAAPESLDEEYLAALRDAVVDPALIDRYAPGLQLVFTPLHGTGGKLIPRLFESFGCKLHLVEEQAIPDGRFPTVASPNPENSEAFTLAEVRARATGADAVFGTDPDTDRMGVLGPDGKGGYVALSGNQIGAALASYRIERMFELGILTPATAGRAAILKTFVTTDLLNALAAERGLKCIETLTGFKYIGEKLKDYEEAAGGAGCDGSAAWRERLLATAAYNVFASEESYGYLAGDAVRDKDANLGALMLLETLAWCKSRGISLLDLLRELYLRHGFYWERLGTLTFEGAAGAAKIRELLDAYENHPPREWNGHRLERARNFARDSFCDADGKAIPKELMLLFDLSGGIRVAVRGSGTEPKIKYYFFAKSPVASQADLARVQVETKEKLEELWQWVAATARD